MKSVLISIRPQWCEKIANGEKTIEVRKTRPKIETPFKCYIYQTKERKNNNQTNSNGKVIGEFVCKKITYFGNVATDPWERLLGSIHEEHKKLITKEACLSESEILQYKGHYGWHISNLKIYNTSLELSQFVTEGECDCINCRKCYWYDRGNGYNVEADCNLVYEYLGIRETLKPLFRPPQSWCYVEDGESR